MTRRSLATAAAPFQKRPATPRTPSNQPSPDTGEISGLGACEGFLYVMTKDSVSPNSECKKEWTRALRYKKSIIPLLVHRHVELPYRLEPRQYIDFSHSFDAGLARLRDHLRWRGTAEGVLHTLKERLNDARRDLARADPAEKTRIRGRDLQGSKDRSSSRSAKSASIERPSR